MRRVFKTDNKKSRLDLITEGQLKVLHYRLDGVKQEDIARLLGTTRQNVSLIEKRARNNLEKAEESLRVYRRLMTAATVELKSGTHLVDVRGYSLTPLIKPVKR